MEIMHVHHFANIRLKRMKRRIPA